MSIRSSLITTLSLSLNLSAYILVLPAGNAFSLSYSTTGQPKRTWFVSLPKGISGYDWEGDGEEGEFYGRSVKSDFF